MAIAAVSTCLKHAYTTPIWTQFGNLDELDVSQRIKTVFGAKAVQRRCFTDNEQRAARLAVVWWRRVAIDDAASWKSPAAVAVTAAEADSNIGTRLPVGAVHFVAIQQIARSAHYLYENHLEQLDWWRHSHNQTGLFQPTHSQPNITYWFQVHGSRVRYSRELQSRFTICSPADNALQRYFVARRRDCTSFFALSIIHQVINC